METAEHKLPPRFGLSGVNTCSFTDPVVEIKVCTVFFSVMWPQSFGFFLVVTDSASSSAFPNRDTPAARPTSRKV